MPHITTFNDSLYYLLGIFVVTGISWLLCTSASQKNNNHTAFIFLGFIYIALGAMLLAFSSVAISFACSGTVQDYQMRGMHNGSAKFGLSLACADDDRIIRATGRVLGNEDKIQPQLEAAKNNQSPTQLWTEGDLIMGLKIQDTVLKNPERSTLYKTSFPPVLIISGLLLMLLSVCTRKKTTDPRLENG